MVALGKQVGARTCYKDPSDGVARVFSKISVLIWLESTIPYEAVRSPLRRADAIMSDDVTLASYRSRTVYPELQDAPLRGHAIEPDGPAKYERPALLL